VSHPLRTVDDMGKHTDVVTYPRHESPFGDALPVAGYIHRVARPEAPGGVATIVIDSVEVLGEEVRAVVTTWDGPLAPVPDLGGPTGPFDWAEEAAPSQTELFPVDPVDRHRRSHPAGGAGA